MRVVQINFFVSAAENRPEDILRGTPSLVNLATSARAAGADVSVIQGSGHEVTLRHEDVDFHFLRPVAGEQHIAGSDSFAALIRRLDADVFHVHGLGFPREVLELARLAPAVPILLQDHANRVPRLWHRARWRAAARHVAGYAFCALPQAEPFAQARLLGPTARLFEIPEASSRFEPGDREEARRRSGVQGEPALLWVGHLNDNKDPLTLLRGLAECVADLPGVQLWCCYATAPLLAPVQCLVERDPRLRGRVHLLGRQDASSIQTLMRAADFFVLGSHREGSGFALLEAMASGLPAVVTDIHSFRALTGGAPRAFLWTPGDPQAFRAALMAAVAARKDDLRPGVRSHFERHASYPALAERLVGAYRELASAAT